MPNSRFFAISIKQHINLFHSSVGWLRVAALSCVLLLFAPLAMAEVTLPAIFSEHMVLQKTAKAVVWGNAKPGERVKVSVADASAEAKADADGKWKVVLNLSQANDGPHTAVVEGENRIEIKDVLVGEVWLCSGQSNASYPMYGVANAAEEIKKAQFPKIRLFQVAVDPTLTPAVNCRGKWLVCDPASVKDFSALGYFFSRGIHQELNIPVGMIQAAEGGTGAELWISRQGLAAEPELKPLTDRLNAICERAKDWDPAARHENTTDGKWSTREFSDSSWLDMELPQSWQNAGYNINGQIYFRKEVLLPKQWIGKDLTLSLGRIGSFDETRINGVHLANTSEGQVFRKYTVPAAMVKDEHLLVAIRAANGQGWGGFFGEPADMSVSLAGEPTEKPVSLAGTWRFTTKEGNAWIPTSLYNGMIHPLIPFAIKGVIWYQGESNGDWFLEANKAHLSPFYGIDRARQYRFLFPALIDDWRKSWGQGDFPFLFVQLPNQTKADHVPAPGDRNDWAEVREAQTMTLKLPGTAMAVTFDLNREGDLHPTNKADFSKRLEALALCKVYGKPVPCESPLYDSMTIEQGAIRVKFKNVVEKLVSKDGSSLVGTPTLRCFAIAGENKQWSWATAKIEGDSVIVSAPEVPQPVAVRYCWPAMGICTLFSSEGFPAAPFRTDDW